MCHLRRLPNYCSLSTDQLESPEYSNWNALLTNAYLSKAGFLKGPLWRVGGLLLLGIGYYLFFGLVVVSFLLYRRRHASPPGTLRELPSTAVNSRAGNPRAGLASFFRVPAIKSRVPTQVKCVRCTMLPSDRHDYRLYLRAQGGALPPGGTPEAVTTRPVHIPEDESELGPPEHAILSFRDICYDVLIPGSPIPLRLLNNISASVKSGQLMALMGASGVGASCIAPAAASCDVPLLGLYVRSASPAGKTTLLDVLAFRKNSGVVRGSVTVNGLKATHAFIGRISGFAEQLDVHMPTATVREALEFSAALRLGPGVASSRLQASFVSRTLRLLNLPPSTANRLSSSLSSAERKLLTIGVELAENPSILFLDEPTVCRRWGSGLLASPHKDACCRRGWTPNRKRVSSQRSRLLRRRGVPSCAPFTSQARRYSLLSRIFSWSVQ